MDRTVLVGRMAEAVLVPCPGRTTHRTGRRVDQFAVQPAGTDVDDALRVHVAREVPDADHAVEHLSRPDPADVTAGQCTREQHRALEAAIERVDGRRVRSARQAHAA